ncbi:Auxin-responsive protein SAUR62 [Bienertia sinuspersici]
MAEEEFGLMSEGPITLPCDSSFMEYAISILQRHASEALEKADFAKTQSHGFESEEATISD